MFGARFAVFARMESSDVTFSIEMESSDVRDICTTYISLHTCTIEKVVQYTTSK